MEAKRISQKAVKNMINGNTTLLHIGNFDAGKRTNLKRAVSECVYTSRLYYNKELQSDNEKIEYLVYSQQPYRVFKIELYETHIAAFNEYTEYHIDFDDTSKYYTLVISGMQFLIVSDLGWCNIWQVFNTDTPVTTDCKQETETNCEQETETDCKQETETNCEQETETNCEQVYDVVFNDDTASNCKHINSTYEYCMQWIEANRHDNTTYFADYKGGTVSIVEVNTGNYVYTENI